MEPNSSDFQPVAQQLYRLRHPGCVLQEEVEWETEMHANGLRIVHGVLHSVRRTRLAAQWGNEKCTHRFGSKKWEERV